MTTKSSSDDANPGIVMQTKYNMELSGHERYVLSQAMTSHLSFLLDQHMVMVRGLWKTEDTRVMSSTITAADMVKFERDMFGRECDIMVKIDPFEDRVDMKEYFLKEFDERANGEREYVLEEAEIAAEENNG